MGRGNWIPDNCRDIEYQMVYANIRDGIDFENNEDAAMEAEFAWEDFLSELKCILPPSFTWLKDRQWRGRDELIVARNGLVDIVVADNEWSTAVALIPNVEPDEGSYNFAVRYLSNQADKVFVKLAEVYDLHVRCGAWMSGPYVPPSHLQKAA